MYKDGEKYRPSNGTEGMWFEESYCMHCLHCDPNPEGKRQCDILMRAFLYGIDEPQYPKEWQYKNNRPICTAYQKWDWYNDGDPDDPDNPNKPPDPIDPNQLDLFPFYPDERVFLDTSPVVETGCRSVEFVP